VGQLQAERVRQVGIDLEGVPEPELPVGNARRVGEVLVDER
jgi:hypothetical protein